ncbi:hypothetical protein HYFRA_00004451 [Hymenoscyphus fraxineus]|uniref:Uncharacterized protein n=1 Tax=Hymenoscyphus fraxineus TaxID=746836 RepID=A0A9N9KVI2_9HELO|nr:hypothetical protein HYFRA_00004451 [Hymenoscyphus fraxineus]
MPQYCPSYAATTLAATLQRAHHSNANAMPCHAMPPAAMLALLLHGRELFDRMAAGRCSNRHRPSTSIEKKLPTPRRGALEMEKIYCGDTDTAFYKVENTALTAPSPPAEWPHGRGDVPSHRDTVLAPRFFHLVEKRGEARRDTTKRCKTQGLRQRSARISGDTPASLLPMTISRASSQPDI